VWLVVVPLSWQVGHRGGAMSWFALWASCHVGAVLGTSMDKAYLVIIWLIPNSVDISMDTDAVAQISRCTTDICGVFPTPLSLWR
jgi:hypothetical protein